MFLIIHGHATGTGYGTDTAQFLLTHAIELAVGIRIEDFSWCSTAAPSSHVAEGDIPGYRELV